MTQREPLIRDTAIAALTIAYGGVCGGRLIKAFKALVENPLGMVA